MKVRYTARGRAEAKKEVSWWRRNREDCPERVFEELQEAISRIKERARVAPPPVNSLWSLDVQARAALVNPKRCQHLAEVPDDRWPRSLVATARYAV